MQCMELQRSTSEQSNKGSSQPSETTIFFHSYSGFLFKKVIHTNIVLRSLVCDLVLDIYSCIN